MVRTGHVLVLLGTISACVHPRASAAALLIVPDQYPTIQSAITAAANNDSILVRARTYVESLSWSGKDLTLLGESDAVEVTTHGASRVLDLGTGVTSGTLIESIAITEGYAEKGGGLRLSNGASARIRRCLFKGNTAFSTQRSFGGGVFADLGSSLSVEGCTFRENTAAIDLFTGILGYGGAIAVAASTDLSVTRCSFEQNGAQGFEGGVGGAIYIEGVGVADIDSSTFKRNFGGEGGAIHSMGCLTLTGCVFEKNFSGYGASAVYTNAFNCATAEERALGTLSITGNVLFDNGTVAGGTLQVYGPVDVRSNTVAFNQEGLPDAALSVAGVLTLSHNIVAFNRGSGIRCDDPPGLVSCNDVYKNEAGNYAGCPDPTGQMGNISLDPKFCNVAARMLSIAADSPCAPASSLCGLIGALGVGCLNVGLPEPVPGETVRLLPCATNPGALPIRARFELGRAAIVRLAVHDVAGRRLGIIADRRFEAGPHEVPWSGNGRTMGAGIYFIVLEASGVRQAQRFAIVN